MWAIVTSRLPREAAWQRLFGPGGLLVAPSLLGSHAGDPFAAALPSGDRLDGIIYHHTPGYDLSARIPSLGDGTVRISAEPLGGEVAASLWFATWGPARSRADRLRDVAQTMLTSMFVR